MNGYELVDVIEIDGVPCSVLTRNMGVLDFKHVMLQVPLADAPRLTGLPTHTEEGHVAHIKVTDEDGSIVFTVYNFDGLRRELQERTNQRRRGCVAERMSPLEEQCQLLEDAGMEVQQLRTMLRRLKYSIDSLYRSWGGSTLDSIEQQFRLIDLEIQRLSRTPADVLLDDVMAGRIKHPDVPLNTKILLQLAVLEIRSGGYIVRITEEDLRDFYRTRLQQARTTKEALLCNLRLNLEDYAPAEIIEVLEAGGDLAPASVEYIDKLDKPHHLAVNYGYQILGGEEVACGIVQLKVKDYERIFREPSLPEGILLVYEIIDSNQHVICRHSERSVIDTKIRKWERGQSRARFAEEERNAQLRSGYLGVSYDPSKDGVPPWFVGKKPRH